MYIVQVRPHSSRIWHNAVLSTASRFRVQEKRQDLNKGGNIFLQNVGIYIASQKTKSTIKRSCPSPKPDESSPQPPIILFYILILSPIYAKSRKQFLSCITSTKTVCGFAISHACYMSYTSQYIWWNVQSMKLLVIQIPPAFLTYPNISFSTLYLNTFSSCSFLNLRNLVSHLYKTRQNYIPVHCLPYVFRQKMGRQKMNWKGKFHTLKLLNFYINALLILSVSPPLTVECSPTTMSPPLTAECTPPLTVCFCGRTTSWEGKHIIWCGQGSHTLMIGHHLHFFRERAAWGKRHEG